MLVKILSTQNIRTTLDYNERKVSRQQADCLYAGNFLKDLDQLTREDKLYHFSRLNSLNRRVKAPNLHILLNFHTSEYFSRDQMILMTREYMQRMGWGEQPYLVYRHTDVDHPHAHVVSTRIQPNAKALHVTPSKLLHSRQITQELEKKYALVVSGDPRLKIRAGEQADQAKKIIYGQTPTYASLNKVIETVIGRYHYTSLTELNAVLGLYNAGAYAGKEGSVLQRHKGLLYRVLGENGRPVSATIEASKFPSKPILSKLEQQFVQNEALREPHRLRISAAIEATLLNATLSLPAFKQALANRRISAVFQKDKGNKLQHITYVDHETKAVFSGKALGARYTAEAIGQRCISEEANVQQQQKQIQRQQFKQHL